MTRANPRIMGVVNITPDSFSDGGRFLAPEQALQQMQELIAAGATDLDLGAESSRPGSEPVDPKEEWQRLEPVLDRLAELPEGVSVSIDTRHADTMIKVLQVKRVTMINNIEGLAPADVLQEIAAHGLNYAAMHMHGSPATMQRQPLDGHAAVQAVEDFFAKASQALKAAGFANDKIWLDPGIGFGKGDRGNISLLAQLGNWSQRFQLLVGVSRKSFMGRLLDIEVPADRDAASKMVEMGMAFAGVQMIRTHDVRGLDRVLRCWAREDE